MNATDYPQWLNPPRPQAKGRIRRHEFMGGMLDYEYEKQRWIDRHPEATCAEYQRAMQAISKYCGV